MTNTESAPAYTRLHWAKSDRKDPMRIHLLEHQLADLGACFEVLIDQPTIRDRSARAGELKMLGHAAALRLALLAALHDIGKVNMGFQTQIWQDSDLPSGRRPAAFHHVGHYDELAPVLNGDDATTTDRFFNALG